MVRSRDEATITDGNPVEKTKPPMKATVDEEILRTLYAQMLKARMKSGRSPVSNEAMVGAVVNLIPEDTVSLLTENAAIRAALEASPQVHEIPPHLGIAAGVALASMLRGGGNVVVALAAASMLDTGSTHEALTIASTHKLGLIVVLDCAQAVEVDGIESKSAAYKIPSIAVDGHDAVAVYRVAREAINRARSGRGPTLIQCLSIEPIADPIPRIEHYLEKHGWWTAEWKRELTRSALSTKH